MIMMMLWKMRWRLRMRRIRRRKMRILRRRMRMMIFEEGSENIVIILILRKMKYINILEDEKNNIF